MQLQEPSNGQRNAKAAGPNIRSRSQNYAVDCITFAAISMFGAWINPLASILPFILTSWCRLVYLLMTNPGNWENRITSRHHLERLQLLDRHAHIVNCRTMIFARNGHPRTRPNDTTDRRPAVLWARSHFDNSVWTTYTSDVLLTRHILSGVVAGVDYA